MSALARSITSRGSGGIVVDIECSLSNSLPVMIIVGSAGRAVQEARDRLRGAFASSGLELPRRRITLNLAPAEVPKTDSGLDLAMAISILTADQRCMAVSGYQAAIGELGLDGGIRPVRGIIGKLLAGRSGGLKEFFIPAANLAQARLVPGLTLYPVSSLAELSSHLSGRRPLIPVHTGGGQLPDNFNTTLAAGSGVKLEDVVGQGLAKRALLIAAAGGHNLFMSGPPGTGKSMLAQALPSLLPPLSHEEILEVTQLHSLASSNYDELITRRPVRAPHHSTSLAAMVGGGSQLRPGEISLSHRGILLLDEFPEFNRDTLEALRQPLESRQISVSRTKETIDYPANFMLIATANPCPCGGANNPALGNYCSCSPAALQRYRAKLSGPILDRIDLACHVGSVDYNSLLREPPAGGDTSADYAQQVLAAREFALSRLKRLAKQSRRTAVQLRQGRQLNADLTNGQLRRLASLTPAAQANLDRAAAQSALSGRAYIRTVRVARTIADLAGSGVIRPEHIGEALRYRPNHANLMPAAALV